MENKRIEDLSIVELKALVWDIEQDISLKQNQRNQVVQILQKKLEEQKKSEQDKPEAE